MGAEVKDFVFPDKRAAKRLVLSCRCAIVDCERTRRRTAALRRERMWIRTGTSGVIGGTGIGGIMTLEAETKKAIENGGFPEYLLLW